MKAIVAVAVLCMLSAVRADPPVLWQVQNATGYDYARTEPYLPGNGYAYVGSYYGWVFAQNITSGWVQSQTASMALNLNNTNNVDFLFNCSGGIGVIQDVYVYCLGLDLTPMWQWKANNTISPYYSRSSYGYNFSPLVVNNVLYIGDYYGWLYAVDLATGRALWYKSLSGSGGNCNKQLTYCPIRSIVFATCYYSVHAIDMSTGMELWKTASSSSQLSNQAYDSTTGLLYVSAYGVNIYNSSNNGTLVKTVSTQGYTVYIQPFMWGDSWYFFSSTYVTVYNTTTGTSTYSSFSVNSGTSTSIKAYVWGDGNLYALGSSGGYTTGLYQVYPNGTNAAIWYTTSESRAYALTYVGGYVLAAGYYIYAIPVTMGYQATQYTWKTSMSSPYAAVWSPANNGTLITAFQSSTGGTYAFLFAMPFNPNSASGMGVNFPTQYSISQTNIVTNGSVAYTCDTNYYCYGFNQSTNAGWSKQVSSSSLSYYGGVAITYNNLFSARYDNTMVALSLRAPYALVTPTSGGPDMGYTARYPTVVGSDGNIYQATTYTTVMINGQTGALMLKDGSNYPNNQVVFGLNYLYIASSSKLVAYNTKTATLTSTTAWSATNPKSHSWQSAPLQYGGQVYIADTYGYIYAFGRQTGVQVWVNHNTTNNDNAYYVFGYGSSVYTVTSNSIREYDMSSGVFRWCFVTAGSNSGFSPIITPDGTFVWYTDKIYALDLNTRTLRYTSTAFSPSYPPTFVNGALYWPGSSTIYATNAYTGAILFVIRDSSISSRSLAAGWGNQTLWYGSSSAMKAASIAIAANYVTALPPGGSSPSNVDKTEEEKKLWIIAVVVGIVVVIVIIVVIKSKSGGGGDGQRDNNYVSMQQPVNSGV